MARDRFRLVEDDDGLFVEHSGKRIAKRGVARYSNQWISLEPGFVVYGDGNLVIEQHGAALHWTPSRLLGPMADGFRRPPCPGSAYPNLFFAGVPLC